MNIQRNLINIYNNGVLIDSFTVTDTTTVEEIATACSVTLTEAQILLNSRISEDLNNYCCNSPLPTINTIDVIGNYNNPGSITITVDITNVDTQDYTMLVKEGQTTLLNYTGSSLVNTISNLTFAPRQKRIFDIEVISNNCSGETKQTKTVSLGPDGFIYTMSNSGLTLLTFKKSLVKSGSIGGVFDASIGNSIQIQYSINNVWYNTTDTVTEYINNGLVISFAGQWDGFGGSSTTSNPIFGRFRNLTTGGAWEDFGQQIPTVYP